MEKLEFWDGVFKENRIPLANIMSGEDNRLKFRMQCWSGVTPHWIPAPSGSRNEMYIADFKLFSKDALKAVGTIRRIYLSSMERGSRKQGKSNEILNILTPLTQFSFQTFRNAHSISFDWNRDCDFTNDAYEIYSWKPSLSSEHYEWMNNCYCK